MSQRSNREPGVNASTKSGPESGGGYGRPLGPGGGFGQGGYGGFGTQGGAEQPGGGGYRDGTWGNEHHDNTREDVDSKDARGTGRTTINPEELAAARMDGEGGGSRPREETTSTTTRIPQVLAGDAVAVDSVEAQSWQRQAITAGQIMTTDIKTVTQDASLKEVAAVMKAANCGVVPVVDGDHKLIGLVTDRDIVLRACAEGRSPTETRAGDVMTADIEAVTADEEIKDVIELMGEKQIRRIPVVDKEDRLVGMISMGDIANRADHDEELETALERVSAKGRRRD